MRLSVSETAGMTGISVRTLHYYDEIGLLSPSEVTEAGYRYYDENAISTLQEILFFRELNFPLKEIKSLLELPGYSRRRALKKHKKLLEIKSDRLKALISLADKAIKGEKIMTTTFKEFGTDEFDRAKEKFAAAAKEKWSHTQEYKDSEERAASYSDEKKIEIMDTNDSLIEEFSACTDLPPSDKKVQELVKKWQEFITDNYYNCTDSILLSLSEMYVNDDRFKKNLNKFSDGTAQLMRDAIIIYCQKA